jgi:diguanylate cyclase (GGDEF)-like protein
MEPVARPTCLDPEAAVVRSVSVALAAVASDGTICFQNPAAIDAPLPAAILADLVAGARRCDHLERVVEVRHHGEIRHFQVEAHRAGEPGAGGIALAWFDITRRVTAEGELRHLAAHDPLTGLLNRTVFTTHLEQQLALLDRRPGFVGVLFIDLDRFKLINDSLGHDAGDAVLRLVAERLRHCVRASDVIARFGGDEFTVLVANALAPGDVMRAAERILSALGDPVVVDGVELFVGASVGVAISHDHRVDPAELLRRADAALYRAKENGRNRVELFDTDLQGRLAGRIQLETSLRQGIARGDIEVHYQPEVDLHTGELRAVEALMRWRHPVFGLLAAGSFIDLAEETGLIVPISEIVLREACRQMAAWREVYPGAVPMVRCNVSARQLARSDVVALVRDCLESTGLPAAALCLELTETTLMHDPGAGMVTLHELRALGVSLALDDFGTGYSSLGYLKRFPIDVLKIDRSFVDGLPHDPDDVAIATLIVHLADSLGLDVTAEGIESRAQAEALLSMGVRRGQGFLYAPPLSVDDLGQLLAAAAASGKPMTYRR